MLNRKLLFSNTPQKYLICVYMFFPYFFWQIIYFELLDVPITREYQHISLLKFWSTDMIKAFETLDAEDDEHSVFGRLPVFFLFSLFFNKSYIHFFFIMHIKHMFYFQYLHQFLSL